MLDSVIQLDKELFLFLNNLGGASWDGFWLFVTNKWSSIPLYLVLAYVAYNVLGLRQTLVLLVAVALLILVTDQLANFFKYGVQRLRPCYDPEVSEVMRLVKSSCGGKYGYFSAHAANSAAIAFFFSYLLGKTHRYLLVFLCVWAVAIAYSRIYIGVHFPLDVLSGMAIGVLMGWICVKLFIFTLPKRPA
jgi:undecaprenyl-diphosphatase